MGFNYEKILKFVRSFSVPGEFLQTVFPRELKNNFQFRES